MFYKNTLKTKKTTAKSLVYNKFHSTVNFDDADAILPNTQTKICYNFITENGSLTTGYGFSTLKLPVANGSSTTRSITLATADIYKLWHFRYYDPTIVKQSHKLFWNNSNGYLAYCNLFSYDQFSYEMNTLTPFSATPSGVNYRAGGVDYMLFSYEDGMYKLTQGACSQHNAVLPKFVDLCYGYDKLFGIVEGDRYNIFYSTTLDPVSWTAEENTIDLTDERGRCNALIYFDDYLYVFRDYGITKISKYSTAGNFSISNLFLTSSQIYGQTVAKCGDQVVFLAKDGLYVFNGTSTKKINLDIENLFDILDNNNATGCYHDGKYFVACKLNFNDNTQVGCESYANGYSNNVMLTYDLITKQLTITRGVDVHCLLAVNSGSISKVIASFNGEHSGKIGVLDKNGEIFGTALPSAWLSSSTDFDCPDNDKIVKEIFIKSEEDCTVSILTDIETKIYSVAGASSIQKLKVNVKGKTLQTKISSNGDSNINPPKINFEIIENE